MSIWKRGLALAAMVMLLLTWSLPMASASAGGAQRQVIRVAYPIQEGFAEVDENGNYSGYTYEYLEEIAQYTGWDYEFVRLPGDMDTVLSTLIDMLISGDVDLMGGMIYSEPSTAYVDYAGQGYGTGYTALKILWENTAITKDNYQTMDHMRVAVMRNASTRISELEQFCAANHISYELVPCDSGDEQLRSLKDGRADALLDVDINLIPGLRTIAKFAPRPFYFATTKGNREIIQQLNAAMLSIDQADPYFTTTLHETYFGESRLGLVLSDDDKAFIAGAGVMKAGVLLDKPPYQFRDRETGELKGVGLDVLEYVTRQTGLQFELVPVQSQQELDELVSGRQVDVVVSTSYDYKLARARNLSLTRPFLSAQYVMMMNPDLEGEVIAGKRLALPKDLGYDGYFIGKVTWYDSVEACIEAVSRGEADYTYVDGYILQYYINQPQYRDIRLIPQTYAPHQVCLGVVQGEDIRLLEVLNKVLVSIPDDTLQSMLYTNSLYRAEMTFKGLVVAYPLQTVLIVLLLAAVILAALGWAYWVQRKAGRLAALNLKKHYQLYALSNDRFFEYDMRRMRLTVSNPEAEGGESAPGNVVEYDLKGEGEKTPLQREQRELFLKTITSRRDGVEELQILVPDGSYRWVRFIFHTLLDGDVPAFVIGKVTDVDAEKKELDELVEQAQKDSLTQVYNAAVSRERITQSLAELGDEELGAMLVVDVDCFKSINDSHGHFVGDQILGQLAGAMSALFRKDDIVGRLGGDEFTVYMHRLGEASVLEDRCALLRNRAHTIKLPDGSHITVSIGAALARQGEGYESLYQRADQALYQAKGRGRDCFQIV